MKIAPIMAYRSQNLQSKTQKQNEQNVSFGKIENAEVDKSLKEGPLNFERYGAPAVEAYEYYRDTDLLTVKRRNDITYAVYEKPAIDKHENKELFEDVILKRYRYFNFWLTPETREKALPYLKATEENVTALGGRINGTAIKAGIVKEEPCYLTTIEDFSDAHNLFEDFIDAEMGYDSHSSDSSDSLTRDYEPDSWDKAHDWVKN